MQTWITKGKRKKVNYTYELPESNVNAEEPFESNSDEEVNDSEEEDEKGDVDDTDLDIDLPGEEDVLTETTETTEPTEPGNVLMDEKKRIVQNIVENKYAILPKQECYSRICDKPRVTLPYMTKYEKTRLLCIRAQQLSNGAVPLISVSHEKKNDIDYIVREELKQNKLPLIIRRYLPNGTFEDWKASELHMLH